MGLRCRHVISVNQAVGSYIELEGRAGHRLTCMTLHCGDVVSIDQAIRGHVAQQYSHRDGDVAGVCAVKDIVKRDGNILRVRNTAAMHSYDAAVHTRSRWLSAARRCTD